MKMESKKTKLEMYLLVKLTLVVSLIFNITLSAQSKWVHNRSESLINDYLIINSDGTVVYQSASPEAHFLIENVGKSSLKGDTMIVDLYGVESHAGFRILLDSSERKSKPKLKHVYVSNLENIPVEGALITLIGLKSFYTSDENGMTVINRVINNSSIGVRKLFTYAPFTIDGESIKQTQFDFDIYVWLEKEPNAKVNTAPQRIIFVRREDSEGIFLKDVEKGQKYYLLGS